MDDFLNIDWNPPLEDMLDSNFINYERLQRDSTMYRILQGTFTDPFTDLHEDYEHMVTKDMISQGSEENVNQKKTTKAKNCPSTVQIEETPQEERQYVPGIIRSMLKFPKSSGLTAQQHLLALNVLLRFSSSVKQVMTAAIKEETQQYMKLLPAISKEQDEYLDFVKKNWDPSKIKLQNEEFINIKWKQKLQMVESLPRYYVETAIIPFVSPKEIGLNFNYTCLEMGTVPKIILPKLTRRILLPPNTAKINQRFFSIDTHDGAQKGVLFKKTVSQDPNCDILAKEHKADLVISSGGLNCLAVNIDPNNTISWILPIVVKRINERTVVFVDKPLPPTGLTAMQKNAWFQKYNIKAHTTHPFHGCAAKLHDETEKISEQSNESVEINKPMSTEPGEKIDTNVVGESSGSEKKDNDSNSFIPPAASHNLFYRIFSIGSSNESQNELMKNRVEKVFKLLVRSKVDGLMRRNDGSEYLTMIAPKLEHQLDLGAEAVTMEEAAKQWMCLTFRPESSLVRMRIEATSLEYIQSEKRTSYSVNSEIKRLYTLKTEAALTLLYNVAETMTEMNPGRYLMRHTLRNGAFASVYKETDGSGKNVLDLQAVYCENEFRTIPNSAWPALDKTIVTPAQKCFKRMPAMFVPKRVTPQGQTKKSGPNKRGGRGGRGAQRGLKMARGGHANQNSKP